MREAVEICRRLFRGEEVSYRGRVISVERAQLNFRPFRADLPILVAARGKRMIELAGEIADIVHLAAFFVNVTHHREQLALVRAGAARGGRAMGSFEIDISMPCSISDDRAAARRAAKRPAAQGILWMAGAEKYSRERADWTRPSEFGVPGSRLNPAPRLCSANPVCGGTKPVPKLADRLWMSETMLPCRSMAAR